MNRQYSWVVSHFVKIYIHQKFVFVIKSFIYMNIFADFQGQSEKFITAAKCMLNG